MSLHFVIVHLLLVVFFCVQLCSFCFVVNDSLFWLLKALSMKNYAYEYTQNIGRLFLSFAWMNSRLQMKSANVYLAGNIRKRKCRKVAVGHDSEMRLKRVSVQKCSFFRINAGRERSPKCECPSHSPDILEACFPHGTPVFELDFMWVIYAVQNVIWFLVWGLLCANPQALYILFCRFYIGRTFVFSLVWHVVVRSVYSTVLHFQNCTITFSEILLVVDFIFLHVTNCTSSSRSVCFPQRTNHINCT